MNLTQLNSYILEDIASAEHPSDFIKDENYSALILRLPFLIDDKVETTSFAYIINENMIYEYNREKKVLVPIGNFKDFHEKLDELVDQLLEDIKKLHLAIDDLEDLVYEKSGQNIMLKGLSIRQNISLIRRLIFNVNLAFELFMKYYSNKEKFDLYAFEDIHEHLERVKNLALSAEERVDHIHDFYKTRVDEKMNRNMYYLTIISGVFMPLTLITGFFGINTGGLPWVNYNHGTLNVVILSVVIEIAFLVTFLFFLHKKQE